MLSTSRWAMSSLRKSSWVRSSSDFAHSTCDWLRATSACSAERPSLTRRSAASLEATVAWARADDWRVERRSASAWSTANWNSRASYSARILPGVTESPRSTCRRATVPGCSVFTTVSTQATRLPTVSTARCTGRDSALATVMGSGLKAAAPLGGGLWASDLPQAAAAKTVTTTKASLAGRDIGPPV